MAKALLLMELAVAAVIVILEVLIEEADKVSAGLVDKLSPATGLAGVACDRSGPMALSVLCLLFAVTTIGLWLARFMEPGNGYGFHFMTAVHFLCSGATVASSGLEVLKFSGKHLKNFKSAPLILSVGVIVAVMMELAYEYAIANRVRAARTGTGAVELTPAYDGTKIAKIILRY